MNEAKYPFVSVVVCAFNEEKIIHACLTGIVNQSYPSDRYEVQVVDDESTDRTFEMVSDLIEGRKDGSPHIRLTRIRHGGLSVARNSGVQLSKGEIIAFIDGDAVPDPGWLEELAKPFLGGAGYVGGSINLLNTGSWVARFLQLTRHRQFFGPRIFNDEFIGCNMAFRREVFDAVGGFHENFVSRGDETDIRDRIGEGFKFAPAPAAIVLHERPERISTAIKVTWKSATLSKLVAKASGRKMQWKPALLSIEQVLMISFPVLLGVYRLNPSIFAAPVLVSASAIIRRLYLRPLNREIAKGLFKEYGLFRGAIGHFLYCFLLNALEFSGRLVSPWLHRKAEILPPKKSALVILRTAENVVGTA